MSENSIQVKVIGSAPTTFTHATFKASVTTTGKTGPEAKKAATSIIEEIKDVITKFAEKGRIESDRVKTTFAVDINRIYNRTTNEQEVFGYKSVYTASFTARNVNEATAIHDALTSIARVETPTPVFHVDSSSAIHEKAFVDAVEKAKTRFTIECKALGLDPSKYDVTWYIQADREPSGKFLSLSNGGGESAKIDIEPGRAINELNVTFTFTPRP